MPAKTNRCFKVTLLSMATGSRLEVIAALLHDSDNPKRISKLRFWGKNAESMESVSYQHSCNNATTGRGPGTLACHSAPGTVAHSKSTQLFFSPLELDDAGVSVTE